MAQIQPGVGAVPVFTQGAADRIVLIGLRNVNTGDTVDLGAAGLDLLLFINRAVVLGVTSFVEIAASFTGTVVTMPSGLTNDTAYLLAWGASAGLS